MKFDDIKEIIYLFLTNKNVEQQDNLKKQNYTINKKLSLDKKKSIEIKIIDDTKSSYLYIDINERYDCFFLTLRKKNDKNHEIVFTIPTKTPEIQDNDFSVDFVYVGADLKILTPTEFKNYIIEEDKYDEEIDFKKLIEDKEIADISEILKENKVLFLAISEFMEEYKNKEFNIEIFNKKINNKMRNKI